MSSPNVARRARASEHATSPGTSRAVGLRFDVPGERPERFRIIYRLRPDEPTADTVEVIAIDDGDDDRAQVFTEFLDGIDTGE